MFRNYLTAALRNLARNRLYAAINIVGLAVGFTAVLLAVLFIRDQYSYDRWIPGYEQAYLLRTTNGATDQAPITRFESQYEVAAWLKLDFPAIEAVARLLPERTGVRRGEREAIEDLAWGDPDLFAILPLPVVAGDLKTALAEPDGVVLSRAMARKYFGKDAPIGETLELSRKYPLRVMAVIEDLPSNTHFDWQMIVSARAAGSALAQLDSETPPSANGGVRTMGYTYIRLAPGAAAADLNAAMPAFIQRHMPLTTRDRTTLSLSFLPVADIFLARLATDGGGAIHVVVAGVSVLILLAACMNFINLMTARATRRAVEVGVRRASGAWRRDLILQFLGESLIYVTASMAAALGIAALLLPALNAFLRREIPFAVLHDPALGSGVIAVVLVTALLAGAYPAFVLSAFRPAAVLKSGRPKTAGSRIVRQGLVILQFAILIGLIVATATVYRQTRFALDNSLRLSSDQVLLVYTSCKGPFKDEVQRLPGVSAVACALSAPLGFESRSGAAVLPDGRRMSMSHGAVDFGFFELYGLQPLAGRFFDRARADSAPEASDAPWQAPLVINETAMRKLGFADPAAAVGKTVTLRAASPRAQPSEIIGVVPDFPVDSIRQPIKETAYYVDPARFGLMSIKLKGAEIPETLTAIDRLWNSTGDRAGPIQREFLSQAQQAIYTGVIKQAQMFAVFSGIAVFVATLGLLGLTVFTAERRTKEIGIRKTMGAATSDILRLLVWEFAQPVLWANVIAWPLGYFAMGRWLQGFAYHVPLEAWVFLASSAAALLIAVMTVLGQVILAARTQPVSALRYE